LASGNTTRHAGIILLAAKEIFDEQIAKEAV